MVFEARTVVLGLIILIGLREVYEADFSLTSNKRDKAEQITGQNIRIHTASFEYQSSLGDNDNQTNSLTARLNKSSHGAAADDGKEDIAWKEEDESSSDEEEQGGGEEDSKSQNQYSTWERMWRSQIPEADPNEDDDFFSFENKRLWQLLSNETGTSEFSDLFAAFPSPQRQKSISVYNEDAYDSLISKLVKSHKNGQNVTIVASGGSTTCGAAKNQPAIPQGERYYSQFAGYLNALLSDDEEGKDTPRQTVQWIGQGHGARTSLHTAIFFDSFIPVDSDLLLWEFSINDAIDWFQDPEVFRQSLQSDLMVWLEEVSRMKRPAKVILVYYWNTPYHHDATANEIVGRAFEAHATIAREYDFVVGHVNVASFIDEVYFPGCTSWETCPLLSDKHHASKLGHVVTAYLLLNLLNPSKELLLPPAMEDDVIVRGGEGSSNYEWNCGVETDAKLILKHAVTDPTIGWKSPLGTWTLDLPAYDQKTPRNLVAGPGLGDIEVVDKADPIRQDRKRSTALGYCNSSGDASFSVIAPLEPMERVQAVLLVFKRHETVLDSPDINVLLNGSNVTTNGQLLPMRAEKDPSILRNWPCHFSGGWSSFADTYWYTFEEPQSMINSMELCIPSNVRITPKIQAVAFW
mmetsp:Transcript_1264/g.2526  ORF Transcript_1264/g.2526 Transcript_1264/m.2526 type:complete len:634 (+) Transcript_1264:92-1993(+)